MAKAKTTTTKTKRNTTKATKASEPKVSSTGRATSLSTSSNTKRVNFSKELVLGSLFGELLGTFILSSFVLVMATLTGSANPLFVGLAIMAVYLTITRLSGAHFNPAITLGLLAVRKVSAVRAAGYIVAQLLGAMLAYIVVSQFVNTFPVDQALVDSGQAAKPELFSVTHNTGDQWRAFFGEALGGLLVGLGFAAAYFNRKNDGEFGFSLGAIFIVALMVASLGSAAVLNPAVGMAIGAYDMGNMWTILQYAIGPVIGMAAGIWAYYLLSRDVEAKTAES